MSSVIIFNPLNCRCEYSFHKFLRLLQHLMCRQFENHNLPKTFEILLRHGEHVAQKAIDAAGKVPHLNPDINFIEEAAILHDIGIFKTNMNTYRGCDVFLKIKWKKRFLQISINKCFVQLFTLLSTVRCLPHIRVLKTF